MSTTVNDLEKTVNSGLTTTVKKSQINLNQLSIDVDVEDVISTILFSLTILVCHRIIKENGVTKSSKIPVSDK